MDPHYCKETDELWFDESYKKIVVMKNAAKQNFTGSVTDLGSPINSHGTKGRSNYQPWLNKKGTVMLFVSTRDQESAIYMTNRTTNAHGFSEWTEPKKIIAGASIGLGEPSAVEKNGKIQKIYFVQIIKKKDQNSFTTLFQYIEKL